MLLMLHNFVVRGRLIVSCFQGSKRPARLLYCSKTWWTFQIFGSRLPLSVMLLYFTGVASHISLFSLSLFHTNVVFVVFRIKFRRNRPMLLWKVETYSSLFSAPCLCLHGTYHKTFFIWFWLSANLSPQYEDANELKNYFATKRNESERNG